MRILLGLWVVCAGAKTYQHSAVLSGLGYSAIKSGGCKSGVEVGDELEKVHRHTNRVRIYGNECDQIRIVLDVIKQQNLRLRVLVGVWTRDPTFEHEAEHLATTLKGDTAFPPLVVGIAVGNEDIFSGIPQATVIANIHHVRARLAHHGIQNIPVSTAEVGHLWSKELVHASDVIYANLYSFFTHRSEDPDMDVAAQAIINQANEIKANVKKPFVISETGWPSSGDNSPNYYDAPTLENQTAFLELLICKTRKHQMDFFTLEAFDATWKTGPPIERHFGVLDLQGDFKSNRFAPPDQC